MKPIMQLSDVPAVPVSRIFRFSPNLLVGFVLALLSCVAGGAFAADAPSARPPNIVFILADDAGYRDFGCYGHPYARTPNIDRLASEGTRFAQFYSTGVTCCPARTGLMTSRFPATYATYPANGGFGSRVTITELLKKHGYQTGHFGKWHIGPNEKSGTYGIDVIGGDSIEAKRRQGERGRDARIYDDAIKFIEAHKASPFYVNVWGHISHYPIRPPASYVEQFKDLVVDESKFAEPMRQKFADCRKAGGDVNVHMRQYLADLLSMDDDIGRLLKRLDELGLRENTIVVFSTDQGPAPVRMDLLGAAEDKKDAPKPDAAAKDELNLRLNAMGYAGELRGGKHGMYEGGVRVPFIVRWPGRVPAGRFDETSVIGGIDWLPTLCHIAGVTIDASKFDGEDVSAAWMGTAAHTRTKPLFWKTSAPASPSGIREGQWKLVHPTRRRGEMELYDLTKDPGEKDNVAVQNPEIVKQLSAKVQAWVAVLPKEYDKTSDRAD